MVTVDSGRAVVGRASAVIGGERYRVGPALRLVVQISLVAHLDLPVGPSPGTCQTRSACSSAVSPSMSVATTGPPPTLSAGLSVASSASSSGSAGQSLGVFLHQPDGPRAFRKYRPLVGWIVPDRRRRIRRHRVHESHERRNIGCRVIAGVVVLVAGPVGCR